MKLGVDEGSARGAVHEPVGHVPNVGIRPVVGEDDEIARICASAAARSFSLFRHLALLF